MYFLNNVNVSAHKTHYRNTFINKMARRVIPGNSTIRFETSEGVDVIPTFDAFNFKDELLRGVYAYGKFQVDISNIRCLIIGSNLTDHVRHPHASFSYKFQGKNISRLFFVPNSNKKKSMDICSRYLTSKLAGYCWRI